MKSTLPNGSVTKKDVHFWVVVKLHFPHFGFQDPSKKG